MDQGLQQEINEINPKADDILDEHDLAGIIQSVNESEYFDASSMAPLSPASVVSFTTYERERTNLTYSKAAIARLRAYKPPPFSAWDRLPLSRRAAVLVLLFADRQGDLRVVLTMRAASLRNYSGIFSLNNGLLIFSSDKQTGQAAFPGGKADSLEETPFEIARREASEEIGLPLNDSKIPKPFRIEHLCQLPFHLAKTALAVRPCVAYLHSDSESPNGGEASVEESMMPRLDAKEVAAVFSAPFHNFLRQEDEVKEGVETPGERKNWYKGEWIGFHDTRWKMHNFHVPVGNQKVTKSKGEQKETVESLEKVEEGTGRYKVWGMTARMLVDAAKLAYDEVPDFEVSGKMSDGFCEC